MITIGLARELAEDNVTFVALSPGWVKTKMSNWTGPLECPEAVRRMIKVIDGLKPAANGTFLHRDGYQLPWQTRSSVNGYAPMVALFLAAVRRLLSHHLASQNRDILVAFVPPKFLFHRKKDV